MSESAIELRAGREIYTVHPELFISSFPVESVGLLERNKTLMKQSGAYTAHATNATTTSRMTLGGAETKSRISSLHSEMRLS